MSLPNQPQTKRVGVLISGFGSNLQALIDACNHDYINAEIAVVVSNKARVTGLARAAEAGIDTAVISAKDYPERSDYDRALASLLDDYSVDLVVLAGFMRILTADFVNAYSGRMLNIHPSLLPKYPGLNTHQRALDNGDTQSGCSIHFVTAELDGGPIILQTKVPIFADDDAQLIAQRVNSQELTSYPLVVKWFCDDRLVMRDNKAWLDNQPLGPCGYANDDADE
ncbi:phosphoribosylglycinamide formyltransferase [Celerinatantimonas sp. MCCC 1A17872]|uniref:phosphoribosylglycinamide formyltransferase n=1 Tax=Celerinatantimonas sp. MCCC 1A17872 TaxID=3177514 RepID=UPI0038C86D1A